MTSSPSSSSTTATSSRRATVAEPRLPRRRGAGSARRPLGAGQRAVLRDGRVAARARERLQRGAVTGQSTGRTTATSCAAARNPATTAPIGARRRPSSSRRTAARSPLPDGDPLVARLAEHPPRALGEGLPPDARERLRRAEPGLAPPTSRTPVSGRSATAPCRRSPAVAHEAAERHAAVAGELDRERSTAHRPRRGSGSRRPPPSARARTRAAR